MNILITGAKGQVGLELTEQGRRTPFDLRPTDIDELDITDRTEVCAVIDRQRIDLVINAAAYTAVDRAETEPDLAWHINCEGPAVLAASCADAAIPLIHISTDYVYDGQKTSPYRENDPVSPLGVYGRSKAAGDLKIQQCLDRHIILRTAWVYSAHGQNFLKTMLRLGREREVLKVVNDQTGCPTSAADLAGAILTIARQLDSGRTPAWGIYHYCGAGRTTWYEFARAIFELAAPYERLAVRAVEPIPTSDFPTAAARPAFSVLDCAKIRDRFGIAPRPWKESLARVIAQIYATDG
jgi:dTDP-4-dehydrorhamnose reductase